MRVAFWDVSFFADVEPWDVPNPWLLFRRIVVVVRHAADDFAKSFQGFVDVFLLVGLGRVGQNLSPIPNREQVPTGTGVYFAKIVEPSVGGASSEISGRHLAVVVFDVHPGRHAGVCTESVGLFDVCCIFFNLVSGSGNFMFEATEFPAHFFRPFLFLPLERDAARSAFPPRLRPRPRGLLLVLAVDFLLGERRRALRELSLLSLLLLLLSLFWLWQSSSRQRRGRL